MGTVICWRPSSSAGAARWGLRCRELSFRAKASSAPEPSCAGRPAQHGQLHERARNVLKNPMRGVDYSVAGQLSLSWCPHPVTTFLIPALIQGGRGSGSVMCEPQGRRIIYLLLKRKRNGHARTHGCWWTTQLTQQRTARSHCCRNSEPCLTPCR